MIPRLSDPARELEAAVSACAVTDRSDVARILATGPDLLSLLHRLSTGDVDSLAPGEGRTTVVTNAKGRIVERVSVHHLGAEGVLLVAGPGSSERLLAHLRRYTFAEDTGLSDITPKTFAYALVGPRWPEAALALGLPDLAPYAAARATLATVPVTVVRSSGFDAEGLMVVGGLEHAAVAGAALAAAAEAAGGGGIGGESLEAWRIFRGLPAAGHELTEDYNPLEAGLREAVSFTKGCYVGQEVIARLNTYKKVSRCLVRLELSGDPPAPGAGLEAGGEATGTLTSAIAVPGEDRVAALGYVRDEDAGRDEIDVLDGPGRRRARVLGPAR